MNRTILDILVFGDHAFFLIGLALFAPVNSFNKVGLAS